MPNAAPDPTNRVAKLALEDGTIFTGRGFGASGTTEGEVVFNTSMTGYQEILTDPSYAGQIVTMTYPLIGNYRADMSLDDYLRQNNIVGIDGIDTRALVRKLRIKGAMNGVLSSEILEDAQLLERVKTVPDMSGSD